VNKMKYYIGLDIGTNSIGWAVTDCEYNILKYKGKAMWGSHLFEEASDNLERRTKRSGRRRIRRRNWRLNQLKDSFREEIDKVDIDFFKRLKLHNDKFMLFNDEDYNDKVYYDEFPTIHHLIKHLKESDEKQDIRLYYLACSYFMKHRGNFYTNMSEDANTIDIEPLIKEYKDYIGVDFDFNDLKNDYVKLATGKSVNIQKLFPNAEYDKQNIKLDSDFEKIKTDLIPILGDDFTLIELAQKIFDAISYKNILGNNANITDAKIKNYDDFKKKFELLPKGKDRENEHKKLIEEIKDEKKTHGVIPYQVQLQELKAVLKQANKHYYIDTDRIINIFKSRLPYYMGPLDFERKGENSWVVFNDQYNGQKLTPENLYQYIDKAKTHEAFIQRMKSTCTYLKGEDTLPKHSMLYEKFSLLNELNMLQLNGKRIENDAKQFLYNKVITTTGNITVNKIATFLKEHYNKEINKDDLTGIDKQIKTAPLAIREYANYKDKLAEQEFDDIILHITIFSQEKGELKEWMRQNFAKLTDADIKNILSKSYKDYGNLSHELLENILVEDKSIIQAMWDTNKLFMEIVCEEGYAQQIEEHNNEYLDNNPQTLAQRLDDEYLSNPVKRQIYRTFAVVKDIVKAMKCEPEHIFIEMARGGGEKGKITIRRKEELQKLYTTFKTDEDVKKCSEALEKYDNKQLQSRKLFLWFMQLGKCMYTGKDIQLESINDNNTCDIDHIFPRSKVKDDSIHDNLVLVKKDANTKKGDIYPIPCEFRQVNLWQMLKNKKLISTTKYERLMRTTGFTEDELGKFINRQLVETRQSTKVVAKLLGEHYTNTQINYAKAGWTSEFRKEFDCLKCREVNDYHHAKDAYLNIVCGNRHRVRFGDWFNRKDNNYSIKAETLYTCEKLYDDSWQKGYLDKVKKQVNEKNNCQYTKYACPRTGAFYDGRVYTAKEVKNNPKLQYYPLKNNLAPSSRGGYKSAKTAYGYVDNGEVKWVNIMGEDKFDKKGKTIINFNTLISVNGLKYYITGKSNFHHNVQLVLGYKYEKYFKQLVKINEKISTSKGSYQIGEYDKITPEENLKMYHLLGSKIRNCYGKYNAIKLTQPIFEQDDKFKALSLEKQVKFLVNSIKMFQCNASAADLTILEGKANAGKLDNKHRLDKKDDNKIELIYQSPTGLFERRVEL